MRIAPTPARPAVMFDDDNPVLNLYRLKWVAERPALIAIPNRLIAKSGSFEFAAGAESHRQEMFWALFEYVVFHDLRFRHYDHDIIYFVPIQIPLFNSRDLPTVGLKPFRVLRRHRDC